mmetsp:Transcript_36889/g.98261  ORF Transcript_36889/g.98261 Transcript_36889/m.98261 type:complete len:339 (-) Transcript_36889:422-1438(-)
MHVWSKQEDAVALICVSAATVSTLVSCCAELFVLHQLPMRMWRKLFTKQLVLLAVSDIVMALTSFYWMLCDTSFVLYTPEIGTHVNRMVQVVCDWSGFTSVIMEAHISLGLAFSWSRFELGLRFLDYTVCFMPFLGVVGCVLTVTFYPYEYIRSGNSGSVINSRPDPAEAVCGMLVFLACLVAIAYARWFTRGSTPAAMQGVQNRLWMYPASFLISFGCRFAVDLSPQLVETFLGIPYRTGIAANGLMNALIYFHQSRLSKRRCRNVIPSAHSDVERLANVHSFHAIFHADLVSLHTGATYTSSPSSGQSLAGNVTSLEAEDSSPKNKDPPPHAMEDC